MANRRLDIPAAMNLLKSMGSIRPLPNGPLRPKQRPLTFEEDTCAGEKVGFCVGGGAVAVFARPAEKSIIDSIVKRRIPQKPLLQTLS
jgi:hypothetical protein